MQSEGLTTVLRGPVSHIFRSTGKLPLVHDYDYDFVCWLFDRHCEYRVTDYRTTIKLLHHFCFYCLFVVLLIIIIQIYSHGLSGQTVSANLAAH